MILSLLSKTVDSCAKFLHRYRSCFDDDLNRVSERFSDIEATFSELETVKTTLESLANQCDDFARDVSD